MKLKIFIATLLIAVSSFAGHEVLNGGDVIHCPSTGTYYSLDYILAKELFSKIPVVFASSNESLGRISTLIQNKFPYWASDFKGFIAGINNTADSSLPYIWKAQTFELEDIFDEQATRIPPWCTLSSAGLPEYNQIVIRDDKSTSKKVKIIYLYNPDLMSALGGTQKSFVYVHEWLWNISKDVRNNRKLNYLLHTNYFDKMSVEEARNAIKTLGFNLK